ncbi:MAG: class II glutamine amidotransferase [Deltaproteobacteria bacterium]|nr:class II glutamine amidotransferase [Deltaproteobacteria bacterium]
MCRLFGFRSVIPSQVHRSLLAADNALGTQSNAHPDGWGVAHYVDGAPHVTRAPSTAMNDAIFQRLSGIVSSETLLAHVRKATVGPKTVLNCHPFQYGKWVFAHNGEIRRFEQHKATLLEQVAPRLRRFILGDTDSEVLFFILLTELSGHAQLAGRLGIEDLAEAIRSTVSKVRSVCDTAEDPSLLTFIVTDGVTMAATQGGKELFLSTHKSRCTDRDVCPHLAAECEAPSVSGNVNHLVFSSEVIRGDNVWTELAQDDIVGVDWRMRLTRGHVSRRALPVA